MKIKCGRKEFEVTNKDEILWNGACYQLTTQKYRDGWYEVFPIVSKTLAKKLIKEGKLVESDKKFVNFLGNSTGYIIYIFNVDDEKEGDSDE